MSVYLKNPPTGKEFRINQHLSLKLEGSRTYIYVDNRRFHQCMYLLLNLDANKIEQYDEIKSIDEAAIKLNRRMERNHRIIPPETEFWGHCSNIQAWADNDYDTRILHRNLAFPLLKALADAGDITARRKFKEEIAIRYATGHPTVVRFLTQNGYLHYLSEEEFEAMLFDVDFPSIDEFSRKITENLTNHDDKKCIKQASLVTSNFLNRFRLSYKYLVLIKAMEKIPLESRQTYVEIVYNKYKRYGSFPLLKFLEKAKITFHDLDFNVFKYNDRLIGILQDNKLILPNKSINNITKIKGLDDCYDKIEVLDLSFNRISKIEGLNHLENLKKLSLKNNLIDEIKGIEELNNLEHLDLSWNTGIKVIPDILNDMPSLTNLKLTGCRITDFSKSIEKFFLMNQNFRYWTNYNQIDIDYYEKHHKSRYGVDERLYKHFVRWLLKIHSYMIEYNFNYDDLKKFEEKTLSFVFNSGKPSASFLLYLFNKPQTRITSFL